VALGAGVCTVFFDVGFQSYLPQLVDRSDLVDGNAKLHISESIAQIAGPSLGGLLVQALTAPYAVLVDAVSFVFSAALLISAIGVSFGFLPVLLSPVRKVRDVPVWVDG
jgi:hypothetical protein